MQRKRKRPFLLHMACSAFAVLSSFLFTACPPPNQPAHITTYSQATYNYASTNPVFPVPLSADVNTITITGAMGKDVYLVKVNENLSSAVSAANAGGAASVFSATDPAPQSVLSDFSARDGASTSPSIRGTGFIERRTKPEITAFNNLPRASNAPNTGSRSITLGGPSASVVYYGPPASGLTAGSSTQFFWVQNSSNQWIQTSATLRAIGNYCYVWVADANFTTSSNQATDNTVTQTQVNNMVSAFDGVLPDKSDGIYRHDTDVFGFEQGGGPGGDGGIDADQHISILVYDIDGDYSSNQTGGVFGFYWAKDEYTDAQVTPYGLHSNAKEMFYLDAHLANNNPVTALSTLAHEFQHMIHWNHKQNQNIYNSAWFDEMCSMVAEDLYVNTLNPTVGQPDHFDIADQNTWGWTPYSRLQEFAYHYPESGVVDWLDSGSLYQVLKSYAGAYSFGAWLLRNYGGPALFSDIVQNSFADSDAVVHAIANTDGGTYTFAQILEQYAQSLVYSSSPSGSSVKTHNVSPVWPAFNGITYTVPALDLSIVKQYNLDQRQYSGATGPRVFPLNSQQSIGEAGVLVMQDPRWVHTSNTGTTLTVQCFKPVSPNVIYFIMVK